MQPRAEIRIRLEADPTGKALPERSHCRPGTRCKHIDGRGCSPTPHRADLARRLEILVVRR